MGRTPHRTKTQESAKKDETQTDGLCTGEARNNCFGVVDPTFSTELNIAIRTVIDRKRVLQALTYIRQALIKDVQGVFSGTVEVDERTSAATGRSGSQFGIRGQNEGEERRNNLFSGFCAEMDWSGQRPSRMLRPKRSSR